MTASVRHPRLSQAPCGAARAGYAATGVLDDSKCAPPCCSAGGRAAVAGVLDDGKCSCFIILLLISLRCAKIGALEPSNLKTQTTEILSLNFGHNRSFEQLCSKKTVGPLGFFFLYLELWKQKKIKFSHIRLVFSFIQTC